ncbi:MAG: chromate resistance protein, partial [Chloroflexi bacterium]|nr:chromate resistance protein [Chloroflexota bacterium]
MIRKFIDPDADSCSSHAEPTRQRWMANTFDMRRAEYAHEDGKCTFQVMLERHNLRSDAALMELGRIVGDADVPPGRMPRHESAGLDAIMRGYQLGV